MKQRAALFSTTDLLLLVIVFLWALNFTVVKNSIGSGLPPLVFTALRFTLAAIILLPLLRSLTPAERAVSRSDWWKIAGLGLLGNSLYQIFFIIAIDHSTPTNIALILATPPI